MCRAVVTVDCTDPDRLADFWAALLDYERFGSIAQYRSIRPRDGGPSGPKVIFQTVDEATDGTRRLHLDASVPDIEAAKAKILELGGAIVAYDPARGLISRKRQ